MADSLLVGVTWLHRAGKLANNDTGIENEVDFIASVFRYYSNEQHKKQVSGEKWQLVVVYVQIKKQKVRSLAFRNTETDLVIVQFVEFGLASFGHSDVHAVTLN